MNYMDPQVQNPLPVTAPVPQQPQVVYASFLERCGAIIIDAVIVGIGVGVLSALAQLITVSFMMQSVNNPSGAAPTVSLITIFIMIVQFVLEMVIWYFYFLSPIAKNGQTLGKKLLKIKIVREDTGEPLGFPKVFLREIIGRMAAGFVFGLGYFWVLWDDKKQGWHDKIAGTIVVKV